MLSFVCLLIFLLPFTLTSGHNIFIPCRWHTGENHAVEFKNTINSMKKTAAPAPQLSKKVCDGNSIFLRSNQQTNAHKVTQQIKHASMLECTHWCRNDWNPSGHFDCFGLSYNHFSRICTLFGAESSIKNGLPLRSGHVSMDKICVDDSKCPEGMILEKHEGKVLHGFDGRQVTVEDAKLCIDLCFNSVINFGFICRSIMFYDQMSSRNCLLHKQDHKSDGIILREEYREQVTYISLGECIDNSNHPRLMSTWIQQRRREFAQLKRAPLLKQQLQRRFGNNLADWKLYKYVFI